MYYEVQKDKKEEEKQQATEFELENFQIDNNQSRAWSSWSDLNQKGVKKNSLKKDVKKCIEFEPSVDHLWRFYYKTTLMFIWRD